MRRDAVIDAAISLVAENGLTVSVAAIAGHAAISEAYAFRLFGSKRELLLACHDAVAIRMREALAAGAARAEARIGRCHVQLLLAGAGDPEIRAAARRTFAELAGHPAYGRLLLGAVGQILHQPGAPDGPEPPNANHGGPES